LFFHPVLLKILINKLQKLFKKVAFKVVPNLDILIFVHFKFFHFYFEKGHAAIQFEQPPPFSSQNM